jgi:hypothetical protein
MIAVVHGSHGMDSFFFHVKGGQGFNWRHVGQKKPQEMHISLRQNRALKLDGASSPHTGTREPPWTVVMKRALALPRMWPHRAGWEPAAHHVDAVVALVGPTPRRVVRSVDTMWGGRQTDAMRRVERSTSSSLGRTWPSPRGQVRMSHAAPRTSSPILRRTKNFVDQRQVKLHGVGDLPTIVAGCLHRLDACKGGRINGGAAIREAEGLPWPPTFGFRCWLCGSDVLHPHSLPRCCTCPSLSYALHTPVAVRSCLMSSL